MKNKEIFHRYFYLDETSPTGLSRHSNGQPAGYRYKCKDAQTYAWFVNTRLNGVTYTWGLPFVLYELYNGVKPERNQMIDYLDGNKDNLTRYNLVLVNFNNETPKKLAKYAYDNFRNVLLKRDNPDYFKDPKDWTEPESLAALEAEKQKRASGESVFNLKKSRYSTWKN
ncbi:hypothetical protein BH235_004604 [Salmonella enterica subsp. enterica serovar Javiana]|nr:hypothetical protein [Salmonella enterica subsp. enterica serovar Javiana]EEJ8200189.1 hypothetical protein [Salmonella enterica]